MPKDTYNAKLQKSSTLSKFTILNNSTIQKCPKKSYNDFHPNHTISKKFPQEQKTTKWQCPTIKFSTKHEINKFAQKKKIIITHLEIFFGWVWSMVAWVFIIPFYRWMILFPIKCKKVRWSRRRCHWRCKDEGLKMDFKEVGFGKMLKHLRIWRNISWDGRNQV